MLSDEGSIKHAKRVHHLAGTLAFRVSGRLAQASIMIF